jgi:hypothetical protein
MKNFNSFEDFGNQKINEAAGVAPFYDSVSQMNAILASDDIAGKMEMMFIDSMTYAEDLTWILKSKDRPRFILKVTLIAEGGGYGAKKYTVGKVVKTIATP